MSPAPHTGIPKGGRPGKAARRGRPTKAVREPGPSPRTIIATPWPRRPQGGRDQPNPGRAVRGATGGPSFVLQATGNPEGPFCSVQFPEGTEAAGRMACVSPLGVKSVEDRGMPGAATLG